MIATAGKKKTLGQLLLGRGLLTQAQLDDALELQRSDRNKRLLGEVLLESGVVNEEQLCETLAEMYSVPYARVSPRICDPKTIDLLPRDFLEKHCVLPMFLVNGTLTIAVSEPSNLFLIEEIQQRTGQTLNIVASTSRDIQATMQAHLPNANVFVIDEIIEDVKPDEFALIEERVEDIADLRESAGNSPVIKLVNYLLYNAVRDGASDIHIEPDEKKTRVRFRVDGRLFEKFCPPHQMHPPIVSRIKIMAGLDIAERRLPQDGSIHVLLEGRPIDMRVSTMLEKWGEKVVIRVIDNRNVFVTLQKLGFSQTMLEAFGKIVDQPNGIVLVTGPTGSGKTNTLYAALGQLDNAQLNICTVEDPIEFKLNGINQFQTNEKIGFSFASALRSLLRQDPDVIMVGEIRDSETARIAIQAALTGHMVLSTLHTNDAPSTIVRLTNMGVEQYLIAASLRAVVAQRLVRKICPSCREPYEPAPNIRHMVERAVGPFDALYRGKGCKKCRQSGYQGRTGIYELLIPDQEILDAIASGATIQRLRELCKKQGIRTLRADGWDKVKSGITTTDEILRATAV